jgi:hypothetical protein
MISSPKFLAEIPWNCANASLRLGFRVLGLDFAAAVQGNP